MAGDAKLTRLLLGFGLRQFSMHPSHILMVKSQVLQSEIPKLVSASRKILSTHDSDKIEPLIQKMNL